MKILLRHNQEGKWEHLDHTHYSGEAHLQDIIYHDPDVIPIEDILSDTELSSIKLILKEVGLPGSGSTDLVGIDKSGNVFIMETKLATNPETKREVLGQILEYAAFLHGKEVGWLDDVCIKKKGVSIAQCFENEPQWDKESFEQKLQDNLQCGDLKLFIIVDEMNPDLQRTIDYMNDVLGVDIYALELSYFKEEAGMEILVPNVHGGKKRTISKPQVYWSEGSFFEYAKKRVDDETLRTLKRLYDFSKQLGVVDFGVGRNIGTFRLHLPFKDSSIKFYIISPDPHFTWFNFKLMMSKGVDKALISAYIKELKSFGFPIDEDKGLEAFNVSILNDEEKFEAFERYTLALWKALRLS